MRITYNNAINLFWIGNAPLPEKYCSLLCDYAAGYDLTIQLWADHPEKVRQQILKTNISMDLEGRLSNLNIQPVSELFTANDPTTVMLDNLQERERYGEGNIGARIDLIKVQSTHEVGGVIIDFDKLAAIDKANSANASGVTSQVQVMQGFKKMLAKQHLLFDTDKRQPDFIITMRHTQDTQMLRESIISAVKYNTARPAIQESNALQNIPTVSSTSLTQKAMPSNLLASQDPLTVLPLGHRSCRDERRSYQAWVTRNPNIYSLGNTLAASQTIVETGGFLGKFITDKVIHQAGYSSSYIDDLVVAQYSNKASQEQIKAYEQAAERLQAQRKALISKEIPSYSIADAAEVAGLVVPSSVYENSWCKKTRKKPIGYTQEGTIFKMPTREHCFNLDKMNSQTLLVALFYGDSKREPIFDKERLKLCPRTRLKGLYEKTDKYTPEKFNEHFIQKLSLYLNPETLRTPGAIFTSSGNASEDMQQILDRMSVVGVQIQREDEPKFGIL